MHDELFNYSFENRMGVQGETPAAGKFFKYYFKNEAFLCHNFGCLRGAMALVPSWLETDTDMFEFEGAK